MLFAVKIRETFTSKGVPMSQGHRDRATEKVAKILSQSCTPPESQSETSSPEGVRVVRNKTDQSKKRYIPQQRRGMECHECRETGHVSRNCPNKPCWTCEQRGHKSWDCPRTKKFQGNQKAWRKRGGSEASATSGPRRRRGYHSNSDRPKED